MSLLAGSLILTGTLTSVVAFVAWFRDWRYVRRDASANDGKETV